LPIIDVVPCGHQREEFPAGFQDPEQFPQHKRQICGRSVQSVEVGQIEGPIRDRQAVGSEDRQKLGFETAKAEVFANRSGRIIGKNRQRDIHLIPEVAECIGAQARSDHQHGFFGMSAEFQHTG
jgi:hypothetical protein